MAAEEFTTVAHAPEGLKVECTSRGLSFVLDEPVEEGGTNEGMNPVEALLGALGACKCIVARVFAKKHRINLRDVTVECSGVLDSDGFLGLNPEAKVGFSSISTTFIFDADNTEEELAAYAEFIEAHCPVQDTLSNPATMSHQVRRV